MEYQSLLQLTLELEGLLTLRINRCGEADVANLTELDDMIKAHIGALAEAVSDQLDNSDNSDQSDESDLSDKSDQSDPSDPSELSEAIEEVEAAPEGTETTTSAEDDTEIADAALEEESLMADETPAKAEASVVADAIGDRQLAESLYDRLARERAANLSKAFSLNDKFRFRRELFRNSQPEMDEAIEALSQMTTAEEAAEYIYDDLCLSPDSPDVKDFMDIITKHF